MKATILGCGPAGLIAAHTAERLGVEFQILSMKRKSPIGGAQFLHQRVKDLEGHPDPFYIEMIKIGDKSGYAEKVYGDPKKPVSWSNYGGPQIAFSLPEVYDLLWEKYEDRIQDQSITGINAAEIIREPGTVTFSSIPRPAICQTGMCDFFEQRIALLPYGGMCPPNSVLYSGRPEDRWYRTSYIGDQGWTEFSMIDFDSEMNFEEIPGVIWGRKPLGTSCVCHQGANFRGIGRFGTWDRSFLLHQVEHIVHANLAKYGSVR